jgi:hypothetical protein
MSLEASGSLAGALVFSKWKGRPYVRALVRPSNPRLPGQTFNRAMLGFLSQSHPAKLSTEMLSWLTLADALKISTFNAFTKYNMKDWQSFLAPTQATPADRTGTPPGTPTVVATGGIRRAELAITVGAPGPDWGYIIHRNLTTGFTAGPTNVVAVIAGGGATNYYTDSPLLPDTYYYIVEQFNAVGLMGAPSTEVNAVVT